MAESRVATLPIMESLNVEENVGLRLEVVAGFDAMEAINGQTQEVTMGKDPEAVVANGIEHHNVAGWA